MVMEQMTASLQQKYQVMLVAINTIPMSMVIESVVILYLNVTMNFTI